MKYYKESSWIDRIIFSCSIGIDVLIQNLSSFLWVIIFIGAIKTWATGFRYVNDTYGTIQDNPMSLIFLLAYVYS